VPALRQETYARFYSYVVGKAADWLREERRKTLGDWAAFCLRCGHVQRYVEERETSLPDECPQCGGVLRVRCPDCGARIAGAFDVECEECGGTLRPAEQFGARIRRPARSRRAGAP
jgi:ribosomal protein S27E